MAGTWARVFSRDFRHSHKLWVFPLVAGSAWFTTLSILLLRWLAIGRPRYPGQVNPEAPFISDIAAFTLQPVFVAGCAVTGVSFAGTVFAVHHVRYSDRFYGLVDDAEWRQVTSFLALFAGLVAAACLSLLSVFDTFENNEEHRYLLMGAFGTLALSALLTTAVWWDQVWGPANFAGLRKWSVEQRKGRREKKRIRVHRRLWQANTGPAQSAGVFSIRSWWSAKLLSEPPLSRLCTVADSETVGIWSGLCATLDHFGLSPSLDTRGEYGILYPRVYRAITNTPLDSG